MTEWTILTTIGTCIKNAQNTVKNNQIINSRHLVGYSSISTWLWYTLLAKTQSAVHQWDYPLSYIPPFVAGDL